jgi:glycerol dehydrogenase-like iron-containing ADH family enzyme
VIQRVDKQTVWYRFAIDKDTIYKMGTKELTKLLISNKDLVSLVESYFTKDSIIITDSYNYSGVKTVGQTILITSCRADEVENIKSNYTFSKVLAVGGCTALDVARACATDCELIVFPTILSTTCISSDRSKLIFESGSKLIKTIYPEITVISLSVLLNTQAEDLIRWTQSGFGDLFANISASIDVENKNSKLSLQKVKENVPEAFEALEWVIKSFEGYNEKCLRTLARYLHNSSIDVVKKDSTEFSSGSEHILYHKIFERQIIDNAPIATHGQIVGIGALITAKIFSAYTGNDTIYQDLKLAYKKLQLPTNYAEMNFIGISKDYLIDTLMQIPGGSILGDYFSTKDFIILDSIFG